jgi:hypothetical protein
MNEEPERKMAMNQTICVEFLHPTEGRTARVELDPTMTAEEIVQELVSNDFLVRSRLGYCLAQRGGAVIASEYSLLAAGVTDGGVIRVIHCTEAGG